MKRIMMIVLAVFTSAALMTSEAKPKSKKVTIKVGSYNLMTSDSRVKHIAKTEGMSHQRYWCNSAPAVAAMVSDLDCDVIGLQEVCDDKFIVKLPDGTIKDLPFDYGFICLGMRANTPVIDDLEKEYMDTQVEIVNIGDSKRARRIIEGTEEGRNILLTLEKHDFL